VPKPGEQLADKYVSDQAEVEQHGGHVDAERVHPDHYKEERPPIIAQHINDPVEQRQSRNPGLLWIGAAAGAAFLAQTVIKRAGRNTRTTAQVVGGAAGLTAVAPAAYYIVTGHLNGTAGSVWIANLVFAANQIQFVQLRIRAAHAVKSNEKLSIDRGFLSGQLVLMGFLALACANHLFRWYAAMAFLPVCSVVSPGSSPHLNRL
jgi:hypothetical protein